MPNLGIRIKRNYLPKEKDCQIDSLDFSKIKVETMCSQFTDYFKGKSLQAYFTMVEPKVF